MYLKLDILFYVFQVVCGLHYDTGPTLSSALSHLAYPLRSVPPFVRLVAGDGQQEENNPAGSTLRNRRRPLCRRCYRT